MTGVLTKLEEMALSFANAAPNSCKKPGNMRAVHEFRKRLPISAPNSVVGPLVAIFPLITVLPPTYLETMLPITPASQLPVFGGKGVYGVTDGLPRITYGCPNWRTAELERAFSGNDLIGSGSFLAGSLVLFAIARRHSWIRAEVSALVSVTGLMYIQATLERTGYPGANIFPASSTPSLSIPCRFSHSANSCRVTPTAA